MKIKSKEILRAFVDGDHYRLGLDKGKTYDQIIRFLGIRRPEHGSAEDYKLRIAFNGHLAMVKRMLERDGFTLDSLKIKGKPTVYFIVEPGTVERANHHTKLVKRAVGATFKVKNSRLVISQELEKYRIDSKTKAVLTKVLSTKV